VDLLETDVKTAVQEAGEEMENALAEWKESYAGLVKELKGVQEKRRAKREEEEQKAAEAAETAGGDDVGSVFSAALTEASVRTFVSSASHASASSRVSTASSLITMENRPLASLRHKKVEKVKHLRKSGKEKRKATPKEEEARVRAELGQMVPSKDWLEEVRLSLAHRVTVAPPGRTV
jgi:hypothetical protein